jgi:hypothetical protein
MKNYFEAVIVAGRESNNEGFINWLIMKLDHEQMDILQRAAVIYAEQSNSHKPVIVRGGDSENQSVPLEDDSLFDEFKRNTNTPTEPLPAEGRGEANTCAGCEHIHVLWINSDWKYFCLDCGAVNICG